MQPIKPCNTYHAVLSSRELYRGADGKSAFKVYFCDIVGRKEPARTVWALCGILPRTAARQSQARVGAAPACDERILAAPYRQERVLAAPQTKADFLRRLGGVEPAAGVGFITAFPHITKVFRFGPEVETNCHVRAWSTPEMKPLDLARGEGYVEFGCFAEAAIAAEEFAHWASAKSVEEYLGQWSVSVDWPVARNDKLLAYWPAR